MDMRPLAARLPAPIGRLAELAYNLWWSWHPEGRGLFRSLDRVLWKGAHHNPVKLLEDIPLQRLLAAAADISFLKEYDAAVKTFDAYMSQNSSWFATHYGILDRQTIAYFSAEYAIHNSLPIYAGGLGVLAGDYCKEASDLGVPLVGIGFMYPQGYFHQHVSADGWQEELYEHLNFEGAPISPAVSSQGERLKVAIELDSRTVWVAIWKVNIGRVNLFLMDTDIEENSPQDRRLSARLYVSDREKRLQQEILLGIGGVRILRVLGIEPTVWHANEGHAAFMMLERVRELVEKGMNFAEAVRRIPSNTVFTTHTPVPAGNDTFSFDLIENYFHRYWESLSLDKDTFLELGRIKGETSFSMTVLALRMADWRNGVSILHGKTCRKMWQSLWPEVKEDDVPITSVTNGVHIPTWLAPDMRNLYRKYLGKDWREKQDDPDFWKRAMDIPDEELWKTHLWLKRKLISFVCDRSRRRWTEDNVTPGQVLTMGALLDPEVLTIGFARRFTDYKRATLILKDTQRLERIVKNQSRPVQIIFAGKSHPADEHGKHLIQQIYHIAKDPMFGGRIAFVEDYDMHLARYLVHGMDVWLNTPRLLQEASGTSGQKAALNGIPHFSVLDGWWHEGYNGANGWAIGNGQTSPVASQDDQDAEAFYRLLEEEIVPLYYERDWNGLPCGWIRVMKEAISSIVPAFCARRMVKEYVERMYVKAAQAAEGMTTPHD
ncbi:MAG: alpha-glucan phosphorylase [Deltaproteobacteria bacterium CG2_30_43_15]|nr:MAG: alpha-glucan phosphorylase [Deltaproteobacteria bacterium CG2_30_43_15]